jgi:hypothetical protein
MRVLHGWPSALCGREDMLICLVGRVLVRTVLQMLQNASTTRNTASQIASTNRAEFIRFCEIGSDVTVPFFLLYEGQLSSTAVHLQQLYTRALQAMLKHCHSRAPVAQG